MSTPGHGQGEGPDVDKWSKTTQDTLGGAEVSEANGVHLNHCHATLWGIGTTPTAYSLPDIKKEANPRSASPKYYIKSQD